MIFGLYGYDGTGEHVPANTSPHSDCGCGCDGTGMLCKLKECAPMAAVALGLLLVLEVL